MVPQFGTVTTPSFLQDRTDAACLPGVQHTVAVLQLCLECWCTSSSSLSPVPFLGFSSSSHSLTHAQLLSNLAPGHQFWQPIRPATLAYIIMWTPSLPEKKKDTNLRDALPCAASLSLGRISTNTHTVCSALRVNVSSMGRPRRSLTRHGSREFATATRSSACCYCYGS